MTLIYEEPERALETLGSPSSNPQVQLLLLGKASKRSGGGLVFGSMVEFRLTPACPGQKQPVSALLALGEHLERKAHTDPPN